MNFKQFLQEKAMNPSTFAKTLERLSSDAKLGFELEMWIDKSSDLYKLNSSNARKKSISDLKTLEDWNELFNFYRSDYKHIEKTFEEWSEDDANDGEWPTFVEDWYGGAEDFLDVVGLVPTYGWYKEGEIVFAENNYQGASEKFETIAAYTAEEFSDYMGIDISVGGTSYTKWRIVEDTSIEGDDEEGAGLEIVSPPLPIEDGLDDLRNSFRFMSAHNVTTNNTTGLHLNISIPDIEDKLDPLKLILFLGEGHVLQTYDRKLNAYAREHGPDIIAAVTQTGKIPNSAKDLKRIASKALSDAKYKTVNLGKLEDGYLEFRMAGNADYHKKFTKVATDIGRFLTVLELACDPEAEQREYAKKLVKLFNIGKDQERDDNTTSNLQDFFEKHLGFMSAGLLKAAAKASEGNHAEILHAALVKLGKRITEKGIEIPVKTIAEFKVYLRQLEKQVPSILKDVKNLSENSTDTEYVNAFLKAFNIK